MHLVEKSGNVKEKNQVNNIVKLGYIIYFLYIIL